MLDFNLSRYHWTLAELAAIIMSHYSIALKDEKLRRIKNSAVSDVQNVSAIEILKGVFIILFTRKKRKLVLFFLLQKISLAQL
jgi:hypothetical protein